LGLKSGQCPGRCGWEGGCVWPCVDLFRSDSFARRRQLTPALASNVMADVVEPRLMKNQSTAYDARGRKKAAFVVLSSPRWRVIKWSTCLCPPWCSPMQPVICEAISPDALASNVVINAQVQGGLHGSPLHGTMA
jgi:hypothetical protein